MIGYLSHQVYQPASHDRSPGAKQYALGSVLRNGLTIERRFAVLALLLALEGLLIFVHVRDTERDAIARWGCAFATIFVAFSYPRIRPVIRDVAPEVERQPLSWRFLTAHTVAITLFWVLATPSWVNSLSGMKDVLVTAAWCFAGVCGTVSAALFFMRARIWMALLRHTGNAWAYAMTGGLATALLARWLWRIWDGYLLGSAISITFAAVKAVIRPFFPDMIANPATRLIGSSRFQVILNGACSGWEGVGLAFVFTAFWLWISRREFRFPRALLLVPAAMVVMFGLNILRISALIMIGSAGFARVAMSGFHSQAGWIAFNSVVLAIAGIVPRIEWLKPPTRDRTDAAVFEPNRTIPYLLPFAAILAAGMLARAASDQFEWLYPLKFFAAVAALWYCRREYSRLSWRPGWTSVVAGAGVFALWIAGDRGQHTATGIAQGLAALSTPSRIFWISLRTLAAITTVPLAEELAFRGFLLRRMVSPEFESVSFTRFTWLAVIGSSILFGLMHGERWLEGTIAGVIYAGAMLRRGRIGDAVTAHALTNALLAAYVLSGDRWYFW